MIVDYNYYSNTYFGEPIESDEFPRFAARAGDAVSAATYGRVTDASFPALLPALQAVVQKAVCAQIEYYAWNGINAAAGQAAASYSVGKVSVTGGGNTGKIGLLCPAARSALELTGLCHPGVPLC